jgi:hypothetical protein
MDQDLCSGSSLGLFRGVRQASALTGQSSADAYAARLQPDERPAETVAVNQAGKLRRRTERRGTALEFSLALAAPGAVDDTRDG